MTTLRAAVQLKVAPLLLLPAVSAPSMNFLQTKGQCTGQGYK